MDNYISSLEPDMSSTSSWMRTCIPLVENREKLKRLGELLNSRLEGLELVRMDEEAKERIGRDVGKLVDMVGGGWRGWRV